MLAFPGVIYSQPLYFEWLSPGITEDTSERKGEKETGRRKRGGEAYNNGMSNRREKEAGSTIADTSDGLKSCRGCEKTGEKGIVAGWLLLLATRWHRVLFPILLTLWSLASFRFTSFYLRERTQMYVFAYPCTCSRLSVFIELTMSRYDDTQRYHKAIK